MVLALIFKGSSLYFRSLNLPNWAWQGCFGRFNRFWKSGLVMARACEVCSKSPQVGNMIETRGKAKYLGGVGTKITGITRRRFLPNLQTIKASLPSGEVKTMRVCTQCIRSGRIRKAVRTKPFSLPNS
jgi:large subunit ribosomal protein L28